VSWFSKFKTPAWKQQGQEYWEEQRGKFVKHLITSNLH